MKLVGSVSWKDIKYWTIAMLVMAFIFEMISSIVFTYKYGGGKFALAQTVERFTNKGPDLSHYHKVHNLVRPDSSSTVSRKIADQTWEANKYSYEPWLQFRVADYSSEYVNISGFERKCIPSFYAGEPGADTIDIYFFGGSTMYGYNVSDAETIPSQFLQLYTREPGARKSIRIKNFGIPYYFSKQELLLFSKLLFQGERPDIVIFMDGLNDFYPSRMLYYDKPHFSYAMQQVFDDQIFLKKKRTIVDTSEHFYNDHPALPAAEYYQSLLDRYLNNVTQASRLAEQFGVQSFFFCQPVPFFRYSNRANDPISYKVNYGRFDYIYPRIEEESSRRNNLFFLGNMLRGETKLPFVDQVHYSPAFNTLIAQEMLARVQNLTR